MLASGIPGREQYITVVDEPGYAELHAYSREFKDRCEAGGRASTLYRMKWVADPFLQWSRRWEYVYVLQRLREWRKALSGRVDIVDAGSGFTFFPFYLQSKDHACRVLCFDNDTTVGGAMNEVEDLPTPIFCLEDLEKLEQQDDSVDAVYSVSVIEHTAEPARVIDEVHRILKPGGLFVCTFDVSFEPASPMHVRRVQALIDRMNERFEPEEGWTDTGIDDVESDQRAVTTHWVSQVAADTLPWRYPRAVWLYDALRGRWRNTLYRPMTFYCGCYSKRADR